MNSFQVFRIHEDAGRKQDASALARAVNSQQKKDQICPSTPIFCTLLYQLPQNRAFTDSEGLPPSPKRLCLADRHLKSHSILVSNSLCLPQLSPLDQFSTSLAISTSEAQFLPSPVIKPPLLKKPRGRPRKSIAVEPLPMPKKMGCPCKNMTDSFNQSLLDRKTAQEMEFIRHTKANESTKEKKLRQYANKSRRHGRECAQAL